jgi:uncharacterized membrane protein YphA (DoxX/SURF4 family)
MTDAVLTVLQVTVGLVLVGAGATKLADRAGFAATLAGLGAPARPARVGATVVAVVEIGLGAACIAGIGGRPIHLLVFVLTLGFVAVTAAATRWRPQVRCRCFGALSESRFGSVTLTRGLVLATASGVVALAARPAEIAVFGPADTVLLIGFAVVFGVGCGAAATALDLMRRT